MHRFYKYQGAGNDFIVFDNRNRFFDRNNPVLVKKLCDRRFGIGADGLMLLQDHADYDFEMVYYNADGREGSLCGNGGRCIAAFANRLGIFTDKTDFMAADGVHAAELSVGSTGIFQEENAPQEVTIKLQMNDVRSIQKIGADYVLDTGSPHLVRMVEQLNLYPVVTEGRKIRYHKQYEPGGINVNFIEQNPHGGFAIRTYERGVEDETLACGTGATAAAMAMAYQQQLSGEQHIPIKALGGDLMIHFHLDGEQFTQVFLEGPATFVYEGKIDF